MEGVKWLFIFLLGINFVVASFAFVWLLVDEDVIFWPLLIVLGLCVYLIKVVWKKDFNNFSIV